MTEPISDDREPHQVTLANVLATVEEFERHRPVVVIHPNDATDEQIERLEHEGVRVNVTVAGVPGRAIVIPDPAPTIWPEVVR